MNQLYEALDLSALEDLSALDQSVEVEKSYSKKSLVVSCSLYPNSSTSLRRDSYYEKSALPVVSNCEKERPL